MKILFCSFVYRPSIGGIETVSALLAEQFRRLGHDVLLITRSAGSGDDTDAVPVVRRPNARRLLALVRWADVVFHNNVSLRLAWPLALVPRPWVVAHHTWLSRLSLAAFAKRLVLRRARHIAPSRALAGDQGRACSVVPNPYSPAAFGLIDGRQRDRELLFVGRLVSDKGVNVLLDALERLRRRGRVPQLTIVGDGPERERLRAHAGRRGVAAQVDFAGTLRGRALAEALNDHRMLVVPSVWEEPFGIVALEAIACGCVPLVARSGGLPDAVGDAGVVVPRGDPDALADAIAALLDAPGRLEQLRANAARHLARHAPERVAREYLRIIAEAGASHADPGAARAV